MKRIIQAVVVAALFTSTQAKAEGDAPIVLPSQWTHADQAAQGGAADAFPGGSEEMIVLPARADGQTEVAKAAPADAFPGSAREDPIVVESMSTYADRFAGERSVLAGGASDPALSQ